MASLLGSLWPCHLFLAPLSPAREQAFRNFLTLFNSFVTRLCFNMPFLNPDKIQVSQERVALELDIFDFHFVYSVTFSSFLSC